MDRVWGWAAALGQAVDEGVELDRVTDRATGLVMELDRVQVDQKSTWALRAVVNTAEMWVGDEQISMLGNS